MCFCYVPPSLHLDEEELNLFNKRLLEVMQLGGQAFLSSTTIRGAFSLRACIINHRSAEDDIDFLVNHVRKIGQTIEAASDSGKAK